uniref:C-type lectin domain-containing protein n=1 Tax=Salmo trutta TaxID=8032 RepID=A0A673Y533_SALTR
MKNRSNTSSTLICQNLIKGKYYCYHFETEMVKNWQDAESYCASQRGHLASFHTQEELSFITSECPPATNDVWIGLNDLGFSDNHAGTCVGMTTGLTGGFWDDKPCTEVFPFVCETPRPDITPPTKPPTPPPSPDCADGWTAERHFRNCYKVKI